MISLVAADGNTVTFDDDVPVECLYETIQEFDCKTVVMVQIDKDVGTVSVWKIKKFYRNTRMLVIRMTNEISN